MNGKINWIVPQITKYDPDNLQFNVDISING